MLNKNNPAIKTLSSVNFALFIISAIAVTSIAGTIVPQGESIQFYADRFGSKPAVILELLDITNMYSSYWFQGLLILFCLNLIVCTWVRFPGVLAIIIKDNLSVPVKSITESKEASVLSSDLPYDASRLSTFSAVLAPLSLTMAKGHDKECLYLHEKGAWSRAGAYIVHVSILLIICGALVGSFFGYKAFVMVPEGTAESSVHESGKGHEEIPLGFDVFCQNFKTDYYPNGTPKEYSSDLIITESGKKVLDKTITVNDPLKYKGVTFFQSSYQPIDNEYKLVVTKTASSDTTKRLSKTLYLNPLSEHKSEDFGASFKILASSSDGHGHGPYKLQITAGDSSIIKVFNDHEPLSIKSDDAVYTLTLAQRFATGLQVVKDPGVWIVYIGSGLMLFGLYVAFFMSHIRIWILYQQEANGSKITVLGKSNKNNMKVEQIQKKIVTTLLQEEKFALRRS
ncbi:MAG: cytochrome c biogenesis protein ResB [Desulforhopalus sp.]